MATSTWASVGGTNKPNISFATALLLTDGSVLVQNANAIDWWRLAPDLQGKYETGTWTGPFNMTSPREYYASGVLSDGRVFVLGGEYSGFNSSGQKIQAQLSTGEIFDPSTERWSPMNKPLAYSYVNSDVSTCIMADGRVLFGSLSDNRSVIWDPLTDNWSVAGHAFGTQTLESKNGITDEETWTLLPDGTVLTVNIQIQTPTGPQNANQTAEKYVPDLDLWVSAGSTQVQLPLNNIPNPGTNQGNAAPEEMGPMVVLPSGQLFAVGASGYTAIYSVPAAPNQPGTWTSGPTLPNESSSSSKFNSTGSTDYQTAIDAPACVLPSGQVLFTAGDTVPGYWSASNWYIFDPNQPPSKQIAALDNSSNAGTSSVTYNECLLLLPTGQVLHTSVSGALQTLTPGTNYGSPQSSWGPNLTDWPQSLVLGRQYTISGNRLNGITQGSIYGDDVQNATNYPLVQLTSTSTPTVVTYLPTFNFSYMGISNAGDNSVQYASLNVPTSVPVGQYELRVITNGIASASQSVTILPSGLEIISNTNVFTQNEVGDLRHTLTSKTVNRFFFFFF
jgi:hypothetical protein